MKKPLHVMMPLCGIMEDNMGKLFIKIFKIFFIFLCFIVALGLILATIKSYMITKVETTLVKESFFIKEGFYFGGKVTTKNQNYVEIRAGRDMTISDINVKNGQILDGGDAKLFTINTDNYFSVNHEVLEEYNDNINDINYEINTMLSDLSKKVGREIKNINELNPNDGIIISAPATGKITGLNIEKNKQVQTELISNLIDDSVLIIPFTMTVNEYNSISVGQDILVTYTGYEGYYKAKVTSINPNSVPGKDKTSYIHTGVIEAQNPGLISPGVNVGIYTKVNEQPSLTLSYGAVVESYKEQTKITTPIKDICPIEVNVAEGELVQKGQQIARLGGEAVTEELKVSIKNIKDKIDLISKNQKKIQGLYGDIISSNVDNGIRIDDIGSCYIAENVYIEYVTDKAIVGKNEVILKYRLCDEKKLAIKATIDKDMYNKMSSSTNTKITYVDKNSSSVINVNKLDEKKFDDHYEILYELKNEGVYHYVYNDNITLNASTERYLSNVVPKTAIIPLGELKSGESCYVYVIDKEETMFEDIDIVRRKMASIGYVGNQVVQIRFYEDMSSFDRISVVNNINTVLKDGMRVKIK